MANSWTYVTRSGASPAGTTITLTNGTIAIPAGSLVVLNLAKDGTGAPSSVVDSAGNAYSLAAADTSSKYVSIWYCVTTAVIPAAAVWTATFASTTNRYLDARWNGAPASATPLGVGETSSGTGTGTVTSSPSISPDYVDSFVDNFTVGGGTGIFTAGGGFTNDASATVVGTSNIVSGGKILTASTAQTGGGTFTSSQAWQQVQAVFALKQPVVVIPVGTANSGSAAATSIVLTVANAVPVGAYVIVGVAYNDVTASTETLIDSRGNTYTRDTTTPATNAIICSIWKATVAAGKALQVGDTITAGFSTAEPGRFIDAIAVEGAVSIGTPNGQVTNAASSTPAAPAAVAAPATANSVSFFICMNGTTPRTATPQAGWTEKTDITIGGFFGVETQYLVNVGGASYRGASTLSGSSAWSAATRSYNVTPPAAVPAAAPAAVVPSSADSVSSCTCLITAPTLIAPASADSASATTAQVTTPLLLALAAAASDSSSTGQVTTPAAVVPAPAASASSSTGAVTAPTLITPAPAASLSTTTGLVTAATRIAPAPAASASTSTLALSAATLVAPQAAASTSASTGLVRAQTLIQPATAASVSSSTGSVTSGGVLIIPTTAASVSSSAAQITAQTRIVPGSSASASGSTGAVTAQTFIVPNAAASVSASSGTVTAVGGAAIVPGTAASVSTSSALVTARSFIPAGTAGSVSSSTASVTAAVGLNPSPAVSTSTSAGAVTAPALTTFSPAASASASSMTLRTGARVIPATAASSSSSTGTLMTGAKLICDVAASVSTSVGVVTIFGHDLPARIRGRGGRAPELTSHPAAGIDSTPSAPLVDDGISSRDPRAVELRT